MAFTWRFNEHSKDLKSEVCLEGYDLFSPLETSINEHSKDLKSEVCLEGYDLFSPLERFMKLCFLGSLS